MANVCPVLKKFLEAGVERKGVLIQIAPFSLPKLPGFQEKYTFQMGLGESKCGVLQLEFLEEIASQQEVLSIDFDPGV
jgi:hypothetical protein